MFSPASLRAAIKIAVAAALAGATALTFRQVEFAWYPLLAVVMCMDETDTRVVAASRARVLGTIAAGLVSFLVHTMLGGWIGLTVALLIVVPLLRIFHWQASLGTAVVVCSMLFLVARYSQLDWLYVLNRTTDTLVGVVAATTPLGNQSTGKPQKTLKTYSVLRDNVSGRWAGLPGPALGRFGP